MSVWKVAQKFSLPGPAEAGVKLRSRKVGSKLRSRPRIAEGYVHQLLNAKLRGYYNYYGVNGNYASLEQFYDGALRLLLKWLNRRSQRNSFTWAGFKAAVKNFKVERPRIVGRPKTRMVPSAVKAG